MPLMNLSRHAGGDEIGPPSIYLQHGGLGSGRIDPERTRDSLSEDSARSIGR
jgi:hypothetical protein